MLLLLLIVLAVRLLLRLLVVAVGLLRDVVRAFRSPVLHRALGLLPVSLLVVSIAA